MFTGPQKPLARNNCRCNFRYATEKLCDQAPTSNGSGFGGRTARFLSLSSLQSSRSKRIAPTWQDQVGSRHGNFFGRRRRCGGLIRRFFVCRAGKFAGLREKLPLGRYALMARDSRARISHSGPDRTGNHIMDTSGIRRARRYLWMHPCVHWALALTVRCSNKRQTMPETCGRDMRENLAMPRY